MFIENSEPRHTDFVITTHLKTADKLVFIPKGI